MFPLTVGCRYGKVFASPIYMVPYKFLIPSIMISPGEEIPICGGLVEPPE